MSDDGAARAMRVVVVNGSPRRKGSTAAILHAIGDRLAEHAGVEVRFYDLADADMAACKGCGSCFRRGSCCLHDDVEGIVRDIAACDALVMGTPTYATNMSGLLKTFVDRSHLVMEQAMAGKRTLVVATYENYGGTHAAAAVRDVLGNAGAALCGVLVERLPFNARVDDARVAARARRAADRLHGDIVRRRAHPVQSLRHAIAFTVGIRPFVLAQGERYAGVVEGWRRNGAG